MKYDDLKNVIREVLDADDGFWARTLKTKPQTTMVPSDPRPAPKEAPRVADNLDGAEVFATEEEARKHMKATFDSTQPIKRIVRKTKEGQYFVQVVNDPRKGT
tara:strand:- start:51929 stop:52237 length:309 start_codon:yes stop_codon:yes gene_type:complete